MATHTPGPWHVEAVNEDGEVLIVSEPGAEPGYPRESFTIAESTFENSPRGLANARLIAAAPELLAFAEKAARLFDCCETERLIRFDAVVEDARVLIRKATEP
jgi:hypothetical protein